MASQDLFLLLKNACFSHFRVFFDFSQQLLLLNLPSPLSLPPILPPSPSFSNNTSCLSRPRPIPHPPSRVDSPLKLGFGQRGFHPCLRHYVSCCYSYSRGESTFWFLDQMKRIAAGCSDARHGGGKLFARLRVCRSRRRRGRAVTRADVSAEEVHSGEVEGE